MADDDTPDLSGDEAAAGAVTAGGAAGSYSRAASCTPSGVAEFNDCDSGSEDEGEIEEFEFDEQEQADTTARQHAMQGRDLQGIPWERLQVQRDRYRQQRLQQYRNYMNCIAEEEWASVRREMVAGWPQPTKLPKLQCPYQFIRNWRAVSSSIVHFQLRNLLWASSAHDVYVVYDNRVQHWNSVTRSVGDVLDLRGAPKGPRLPGLGRVQVSTLGVHGELLAAGGFTGELVLGRLTRTDTACWGEDDSDEGLDDGSCTETAVAAAQSGPQYYRQVDGAVTGEQEMSGWNANNCYNACASSELAQASSQLQHGPATQQYIWSWQQQRQAGPLQQQQLLLHQSSWRRQQPAHLQTLRQWRWQDGCYHEQACEPQQQQHWPPYVRLSHDQPEQQQEVMQQDAAQQHQQQHGQHLQQHCPTKHMPPRHQQLRRHQQLQQDEQERLMGASGPAACEVLHSCRVTQSENGITNGIEIFDSSSYGQCVMTSNNDCCVRLFDVEGCRPRQRLEFPFAVNYSTMRPDGAGVGGAPVIAVVGDDPNTWLVDCRSGLEVMKLKGHRDFSFAAVWHPNGHLLATGNQDSTTRVWDVRQTSTPVAVLGGSMGAIRSLRFSPDGACLAAAEPADFVHVFDVASDFSRVQEIDLFGEVAGISFSPDAQSLFVAISDTLYSSLVQYQRTSPQCIELGYTLENL